MGLVKLPAELLVNICQCLDYDSVLAARSACRLLKGAVESAVALECLIDLMPHGKRYGITTRIGSAMIQRASGYLSEPNRQFGYDELLNADTNGLLFWLLKATLVDTSPAHDEECECDQVVSGTLTEGDLQSLETLIVSLLDVLQQSQIPHEPFVLSVQKRVVVSSDASTASVSKIIEAVNESTLNFEARFDLSRVNLVDSVFFGPKFTVLKVKVATADAIAFSSSCRFGELQVDIIDVDNKQFYSLLKSVRQVASVDCFNVVSFPKHEPISIRLEEELQLWNFENVSEVWFPFSQAFEYDENPKGTCYVQCLGYLDIDVIRLFNFPNLTSLIIYVCQGDDTMLILPLLDHLKELTCMFDDSENVSVLEFLFTDTFANSNLTFLYLDNIGLPFRQIASTLLNLKRLDQYENIRLGFNTDIFPNRTQIAQDPRVNSFLSDMKAVMSPSSEVVVDAMDMADLEEFLAEDEEPLEVLE
jgi:hypothetical protein